MKEKGAFINIAGLGEMFIYDVLVSYVCPVSFVCVDEYDTKYLFYEIIDENDYIEWLASKLSKDTYYEVIDKKISIQKAFKKSSFLIRIKKVHEENIATYVVAPKQEFAFLPKKDVFAEKESFEDNFREQTLITARKTGMTTFDVRLYGGSDRHSVSHTFMKDICGWFNSLVSSFFGQRREERINVCTAPGSCVIRFSFPDQLNLFDEGNSIKETNILNEILNEPSINTNVQKVADKKKFVTSYTNFLNTIKKTGSDVEFITASPTSSEIQNIRLKSSTVIQRYESVKNIYKETKETIEVRGTLTALDTIKYKFKFKSDTGDSFDGIIEKRCFDQAYNVPYDYIAMIEITKKVDENNFTEKKSYLLKSLKHTQQ